MAIESDGELDKVFPDDNSHSNSPVALVPEHLSSLSSVASSPTGLTILGSVPQGYELERELQTGQQGSEGDGQQERSAASEAGSAHIVMPYSGALISQSSALTQSVRTTPNTGAHVQRHLSSAFGAASQSTMASHYRVAAATAAATAAASAAAAAATAAASAAATASAAAEAAAAAAAAVAAAGSAPSIGESAVSMPADDLSPAADASSARPTPRRRSSRTHSIHGTHSTRGTPSPTHRRQITGEPSDAAQHHTSRRQALLPSTRPPPFVLANSSSIQSSTQIDDGHPESVHSASADSQAAGMVMHPLATDTDPASSACAAASDGRGAAEQDAPSSGSTQCNTRHSAQHKPAQTQIPRRATAAKGAVVTGGQSTGAARERSQLDLPTPPQPSGAAPSAQHAQHAPFYRGDIIAAHLAAPSNGPCADQHAPPAQVEQPAAASAPVATADTGDANGASTGAPETQHGADTVTRSMAGRLSGIRRLLSADAAFDPLATVLSLKRPVPDTARTLSHAAFTPFEAAPQHSLPPARSAAPATSLLHEALVREGITGSVSLTANEVPVLTPLPSAQGAALEAPGGSGADEAAVVECKPVAPAGPPPPPLQEELTATTQTAAAGAMAATIALAVAVGAIMSPRGGARALLPQPPAAVAAERPSVATAVWAAATAAAAATMASVAPTVTARPAVSDTFAMAQVVQAATGAAPRPLPAIALGERTQNTRIMADEESVVFSEDALAAGFNAHDDDDDSVDSLTEQLGVHVELAPPSDDGEAAPSSAVQAASAAAAAAPVAAPRATPPAAPVAMPGPGRPWAMRQASPAHSGGLMTWGSRNSRTEELNRPGAVRERGAVCILDVRIENADGWKEVQRPETSAFGGASATLDAGVAKGIFHRLFPSRPSVKTPPRRAARNALFSPRASIHMLSPTSSAFLSPQASSQMPSELRLPKAAPAHTVFSTGIELDPACETEASPRRLASAFEGADLAPGQLSQFFSMLRLVQYFKSLSATAVRSKRPPPPEPRAPSGAAAAPSITAAH
eukprot:jgi/Ulvmu1/5514/UM023_0050.1